MLKKTLADLDTRFVAMPRNAVLLAALAVCLLVSALDVKTDFDMLLLYLVPILIASWYGGAREGYVIAVYASIAAEVTIVLSRPNRDLAASQWIPLLMHFVIFVVVARAVSKLRESQSQRRQLTEFIVHDLRSPIASSITGLQTLASFTEDMDPIQQEMVDLALVSNQRALTLVNSILDVSKLEVGSMEVREESTDIQALVQESARQVALWAQGNDVAVSIDVSVGRVRLDPDLTSRVIVNLLSNALKFSPAKSTVIIRVEPAGNQVKFTIKDQGPGIPPEFLESIFEPFAQVKGTKGGTGLGLTFCRLAVQAQSGKIWVESQLGQGTSMIFTAGQLESAVVAAGK